MLPIKSKTKAKNIDIKPFPIGVSAVGYFTGLDVEIFDNPSIKAIHESGCYGINPKPRQATVYGQEKNITKLTEAEYKRHLDWKKKFGENSSFECDSEMVEVNNETVSDPFNISDTLVLFPEEAFFLHHIIECLKIQDLDNQIIPTKELWRKFCKLKESFVERYVTYLYLKSKNWVIKSGIKFGGHFLLYKHGPHLNHASFIVIVSKEGAKRKSSIEYHTNERVAETTGKNLLYVEVYFPKNVKPEDYLENIDKFQCKELFIHRIEIEKQK
ncbi:CLUMA_CG007751, isoform A [Clunio marinus]|uniref:tRNA-intron lyase n=1 Tax=Clunio marinus TaxID=568069 RepID=A0A1J1I3R4_9DIPT|nr:CLUMA_CG007751, isoform A [Clunio marinus]